MGLFIRKNIEALQAEAQASGSKTLKRVLGPVGLVALGVGVIIGAGLFSITGTVASEFTGPAITLSFIIAAIGCCFAGLCYAEFASMIPVSGSAYTYSYATMGELIAWIIGWDLVLEYTVAATTVSISWSRYMVVFLESIGISLPHHLTACPWDGGDNKHTCNTHCNNDEHHTDARYSRKLHIQRFYSISKNSGYSGFRSTGMEIHSSRQLYSIYS